MNLLSELEKDIINTLITTWDQRNGYVVPDNESVKLLNGGVNLSATMLYSAIAHSTDLISKYTKTTAAEIYKLFWSTTSRIIKFWDGYIRSFDGDRVMAVFIGENKSDNAIAAALHITRCVRGYIIPQFKKMYSHHSDFTLQHCTGIDTSDIFVIRGGVREDNDLVWIGRAANAAAKLSELRNGYTTIISDATWSDMDVSSMYVQENGKKHFIWTSEDWDEIVGIKEIYKSDWERLLLE